jgi:hypothetical protein
MPAVRFSGHLGRVIVRKPLATKSIIGARNKQQQSNVNPSATIGAGKWQ